jgi:hypothetical protein
MRDSDVARSAVEGLESYLCRKGQRVTKKARSPIACEECGHGL